MRDELREKNVIIKSLMTSYFWSSKTSQHTKPPNDAYSNLGNNKNNKSVLNEPPEKDPTVDFHVEGNNILNQTENHRVFLVTVLLNARVSMSSIIIKLIFRKIDTYLLKLIWLDRSLLVEYFGVI